jgi:hypothetical protein
VVLMFAVLDGLLHFDVRKVLLDGATTKVMERRTSRSTCQVVLRTLHGGGSYKVQVCVDCLSDDGIRWLVNILNMYIYAAQGGILRREEDSIYCIG